MYKKNKNAKNKKILLTCMMWVMRMADRELVIVG